MSEQPFSNPETSPEFAPTIEEIISKAVEARYLETGDLEYGSEDDFDDVIVQVAMYIEQSGDDAETVLRKWGIAE